MTNETYELLTAKFDSLPKVKIQNLDINFFDLSQGDYSQLIDESVEEGKALDVSREGVTLHLKRAIFIESIRLIPPLDGSLKSVELSYYDGSNKLKVISPKIHESGIAEYEILDFVKKFTFFDTSWVHFFESSPGVARITVKGIIDDKVSEITAKLRRTLEFQEEFQRTFLSEQRKIESDLATLNSKQAEFDKKNAEEDQNRIEELEKHKQNLDNIQQKIKTQEKLFGQHEANANKKNEELVAMENSLEDKKTELSQLAEKLKATQDAEKESKETHARLTHEANELEKKASILKDELLKLSNDKSLFTEDVKGHFREGFKQIRLYVIIVAIPVLASLAMMVSIFLNADKITELYRAQPGLGIWNIIASRIPYTTVSLGIIAFFAKVVTIFVRRLIEIHEKRLRFSEIGILTKDASDAVLANTQTAEKTRLQLRLGMRMKLIREYISGKYDFEATDVELMEPILSEVTKTVATK